jgi:hypothetical protein
MRPRAAIEPVIGHLKAEHRMDRNYLKGFAGDCANAVLAAAGYNFRLLLRWLALLLRALIQLPCSPPSRPIQTCPPPETPEPASRRVLHERLVTLHHRCEGVRHAPSTVDRRAPEATAPSGGIRNS